MSLKETMIKGAYKTVKVLKQYAPDILVVTSVVGVVAGCVMLVKAARDTYEVVEDYEKEIREIQDDETDISENERVKSVRKIRRREIRELIEAFAPAVSVLTISFVAMLTSHGIMRKRLAVLNTAYMALSEAFNQYRERVRAEIGEEREESLYLDSQIEASVQNPESSMYTRLFDETTSRFWSRSAHENKKFLLCQQSMLNNQLYRKGYVTLNDALAACGYKKVPEGQDLGWLDDHGNGERISFGIFDSKDPSTARFLNEDERSVWIHFNVQGDIRPIFA